MSEGPRIEPLLLRLGRRFRAWLFRPTPADEVREEMDFHLEMRTREYEGRGLGGEEARRRAEARLGDRDHLSDELVDLADRRNRRRDASMWMDEIRQDIRYAGRQLLRNPSFAGAAILTLAVGIGANSAVFSVVSGVLLEPLPYESPDELVSVSTAFPTMGFEEFWLSPPEYYELREWNEAFEDVGAYRVGAASIETLDRPLRVPSAVATWSFFTTLGVRAEHGRTFREEEDRIDAEPTAVISHGLWQRGFGGDPGVIGSTVRISGQAATVIGILPEGFDIDDAGVDVWRPLNLLQAVDPNDHVARRGNHFMNVVARQRDGVTSEQVSQDFDRMVQRWGEEYAGMHPIEPEVHPMFTSDLRSELLGDARPALYLLMGAVSFVLLIACANVGNLLLARSEGRSGEVAVRVAMGAGRGRMIRQLVTEGLALSLLGGALGLVLAHFGTRALLGVNPEAVPRVEGIALDARVLAFTSVIAVGTGVLFGLAPLIGARMQRVGATLKEGGARSTRGSAGARARSVLVVAEVAFAVVLLVGSGLMLRSVDALQEVQLGFDPEDVLTLTVALPAGDYPEPASVGDFFAELLTRVRGLPGVMAASATSDLPPLQQLVANDTEFEGVPMTTDGPAHNVDYYTTIEEGYLETLRIPLAEGRGFEPADALAETPVMLVNQRLAETFYPGESPVGRRIQAGGSDLWFTVIGVFADVKQAGIREPAGTELVFFNPQAARAGSPARAMTLVIRAERSPLALAPAVERIVRELDPALPVAGVQTLEQNISTTMAQPRFLTLLLGVFAAVALLLASVGTYGVMAHSVAERNREIGIRMAMGAEPGSVRALVLKQGAGLAGVGLTLGVLGALGLTRFLASQLYQVGTTDLRTFVAVPLVLGAVSLLACYLPARRATRIDPVEALREA
jgi:putative ABC transport system permease protein